MEFEYDPNKSAANKDKHGIDFEATQAIWSDDGRIEIPATSHNESRSIAIGRIGEKLWACVYTWRGPTARLISARRARKEEVELYEQDNG